MNYEFTKIPINLKEKKNQFRRNQKDSTKRKYIIIVKTIGPQKKILHYTIRTDVKSNPDAAKPQWAPPTHTLEFKSTRYFGAERATHAHSAIKDKALVWAPLLGPLSRSAAREYMCVCLLCAIDTSTNVSSTT